MKSIFICLSLLVVCTMSQNAQLSPPTKVSKISFDYWESCETGKGACKPLTFTRGTKAQQWVLQMPCGGSYTTITLSKEKGILNNKDILQQVSITAQNCPPTFDLTDLPDGQYYAYMLACGLGGQVAFNLKTQE